MKYPAGISGEEYAAMEEGYEQGRESMAAEVAAAERAVRQAVWDYCEMSAGWAEEAGVLGNPYAVGLAKGYRDVQEKLGVGASGDEVETPGAGGAGGDAAGA